MATEEDILRFAAALHYSAARFSVEDRQSSIMNFVDGVGAAYAGFRRPEIKTLLASDIVDVRADHPSWLIGSELRCRPSDAVLLNAMAAHLDDFDDDEALVSIAHVTVPTMAAALAAAGMTNCSGVTLLNGYLSGVETMVALGELLNPAHYALGWHASATLGVFGAAMASAHILGLSVEQLATALSFAVTASSGTRSAFGSSAKPWQVAAAARDGFVSAQLAKAGLDANASLFGPMGLAELYGGDPSRVDAVLARIGRGSPFEDPGVTIKAYPCCTAAHTAMEACEVIRGRLPTDAFRNIESVRITVGRTIPSILVHNEPKTALEGKFSMQFCAAAALCLPSAGLDAFTDETFGDPGIRHMMERIDMIGLEEQDDPFLCEVTVALVDGSSICESVRQTKGSPERPFDRETIKQKLGLLCRGADAEVVLEHLYQLPSATEWRSFEAHLARLLSPPSW
ncbi:MmgE/PrpD family protein [Rhizobium sp. BT-226]|uniref:MmgE/PrpD family protein n=1 Tax=Rhizobium sp. BT-226 TaxID=2986922 RepID=UPI0021F6E31A|nr:MmgE/PrpD family protein [Rhizobium sp. BT-226]MCW0021309.1 MmgE/PrpD family protein [Rhizobium sp. BT-226]